MTATLDAAQPAYRAADRDIPLLDGTIGYYLRRNAGRRGERPALIWADGAGVGRMSYAALLERAERVARWLLEQVEVGDRIGVWSLNNVDHAVLFHASSLAGTIIVPFNPGWTDAEARHAHDLVTPKLILTGVDGRGADLGARARGIASCPVLPIETVATAEPRDAGKPLPDIDPSHSYLIQFTSGTTGRAKGALLSHRAAIHGGYLALQSGGADETDVWLTPVPFHHIGGSVAITLGALACGGAFVILPRFNTNQVVQLIRPSGATRMGGVPTMWHDLLRHPEFPDDLRLRNVTLGGAMVPAELVREIEERTGGSVLNVYAQSEFPIMTSTAPDDPTEVKTDTVGRPAPHVELKIADPETGRTLGLGEVGEVCVRGPHAMDGYWGDPAATARAFDAEGFLRTGDLGSIDDRGICRIHGRASEMIIRGGENIYPAEVEGALLQHPAVSRAAVIGLPDERMGEKVAAVVELAPGFSAAAVDLSDHAAQFVSHFKVPVEWRFVEAIPMTASGKVRKIDLPPLFDE